MKIKTPEKFQNKPKGNESLSQTQNLTIYIFAIQLCKPLIFQTMII